MERRTLVDRIDQSLMEALNDAAILAESYPWDGRQWECLSEATDALREASEKFQESEQSWLRAQGMLEEARSTLAAMPL